MPCPRQPARPKNPFFPLRAQEKIEQQHEQQEQRKQELEKQFGEVLTNNQVQMLIVEKQMFSFRLPFTTHFCKHDLDLALSTIKPEEMPQEKVVLAVQKIAVTRAQLKLGVLAEWVQLISAVSFYASIAYICMLLWYSFVNSATGVTGIADALYALSRKIQDLGTGTSTLSSTLSSTLDGLASKTEKALPPTKKYNRVMPTERAKPAAAPTPKAPTPKAREAAKPKVAPKASGDGEATATGESAAVQRMKKLLDTL